MRETNAKRGIIEQTESDPCSKPSFRRSSTASDAMQYNFIVSWLFHPLEIYSLTLRSKDRNTRFISPFRVFLGKSDINVALQKPNGFQLRNISYSATGVSAASWLFSMFMIAGMKKPMTVMRMQTAPPKINQKRIPN